MLKAGMVNLTANWNVATPIQGRGTGDALTFGLRPISVRCRKMEDDARGGKREMLSGAVAQQKLLNGSSILDSRFLYHDKYVTGIAAVLIHAPARRSPAIERESH